MLSPMLQRLRPSATVAATEKARQRKALDSSVLVISGGEPDFDTPDHVKEAAIRAIREGYTKYTSTAGTPSLKAAIVEKFQSENQLTCVPEEVVVGTGGKQVIFNAFAATISPGDEVVLPRPAWVSYADIAELAEGSVVSVPCRAENGFKITPAELEDALGPRSRWFVINSPCNPTGAVYSEDELRALAEVLMRFPDVMILSDDIYEHLVYDGARFATIASVAPELRDRTVTVNGVSKAYCMTGWRIGYCMAPAWLARAMTSLQAQVTTSNCSVSQVAAEAALRGPKDFIASHNAAYRRRRDFLVRSVNESALLSCAVPQGAFYIYVNVSKLLGLSDGRCPPLSNDFEVADFLLDAARIAVVPGAGFGTSPYVRLCFAYADDTLVEAARRMHEAVSRLG